MEQMTYARLLKEGERFLEEKGIGESRLDAWYLFSECFSMNRARYFLEAASPVSKDKEDEAVRFREMLERRGERIPLQQVLGKQEFMGLSFQVDENVLIPRQDTETLVEEILSDIRREPEKEGEALRILDLCTGSGCIGISLAHYLSARNVSVVLSDISEKALLVARENIRRHGLLGRCSTVRSDLFEAFGGQDARFDVVVSNPPYIPSGEIETLEPEVREHEPRLALDGESDGLAFYRKIAGEVSGYLKPFGSIYVEIGWNQGEQVKTLFEAAGLKKVRMIKDLPGKDRVVKACIEK